MHHSNSYTFKGLEGPRVFLVTNTAQTIHSIDVFAIPLTAAISRRLTLAHILKPISAFRVFIRGYFEQFIRNRGGFLYQVGVACAAPTWNCATPKSVCATPISKLK